MANHASGQITISGKVYDSSKLYVVPDVIVESSSGSHSVTDTVGEYHINVKSTDSVSFSYMGKSTVKFPVKDIKDYTSFDISLHVKVKDKYKLLNPVTVYFRSFEQDSLENRKEYAKIFNSEKPGIGSTYNPYDPGSVPGLDLDEFIKMFQFRKNKRTLAFKERLVQEEQDRYVDYRFSSKTITRVTGLTGDALEKYKKLYRPSYEFLSTSTIAEFYQYILTTSYAFKKREGIK